jgi:predicted dehydrogenase
VTDLQRLKVAVIGCGAIGHQHLAYLSTSPRVELAAVCDRSSALAEYAFRAYKAAAWFRDSDEMLAHRKPDVVHVLTPPHTHVSLTTRALEAGAHVICEKPLAPSLKQTEELLALAQSRNRYLIESRNLLFNDGVLRLDSLIAEGQLGHPREVEILLSLDLPSGPFGDLNLSGPGTGLPGGAVHDFLPHLVYLFLHFSGGSPVERVDGRLLNRSGNPKVGYDELDALLDAGKVRGRLRVASDLSPDGFRLAVRGTAGSAETDLYNPFMRIEGGRNVGKRAPMEQVASGYGLIRSGFRNLRDKVMQHGTYHGLPRMLDAIYSALSAGEEPPISPQQIRAASRLVDELIGLAQPQ